MLDLAPIGSATLTVDPALVAAVRRFGSRHADALARDRAGGLGSAVLEDARELGLFGLAIPEAFGGLGLGLGATGAIVAELARVDRAIATTIGLHNGLGSRALVVSGAPELRAWLLPELASGRRIGAFCATEPGAGSDLTHLATTVTSIGERLEVTGEKAYVTNAGFAGCFTVLGRRAGGERDSALVLVPAETAGVTLGGEEKKMGLRASSTRSVFFDRAAVPEHHALGVGGTSEAHRALEWGRSLLAAGCLGTARAALERSLPHTRRRRQFKRALASFGAVQRHLGAMATAVLAIEATFDRVATEARRGRSIEATSAALKVLASELSCDACDRAVQVHGALGFVEDAGVALLLRDARVTRIFEGANDVLLVRLGSALVAGHGLASGTGEAHARLDGAVRAVRRDLGVSAIRHQSLLVALARADVALYAAESCRAGLGGASEARRRGLETAALRLERTALASLDEAIAADVAERADAALLELLGDDAAELVRPPASRISA